MSVQFKPIPNYNVVEVHKLLQADRNTLRRIVAMLLIEQAEVAVDMLIDDPNGVSGKKEIEKEFDPIVDRAIENLEYNISNIQSEIKKIFAEITCKVSVRTISYDEKGELDDIDVYLDIV